jgi:hypothetical protein
MWKEKLGVRIGKGVCFSTDFVIVYRGSYSARSRDHWSEFPILPGFYVSVLGLRIVQ